MNKQFLQALMVDMSGHLDALHLFHNIDDDGSSQIPAEKLDELKRRWACNFFSAKEFSAVSSGYMKEYLFGKLLK